MRKYAKGDKKYPAEIPHCSVSSLYNWKKLYDKLNVQKNPKKKRLFGGGRKSKLTKYEKNMLYWILDCRKLGISLDFPPLYFNTGFTITPSFAFIIFHINTHSKSLN